MSTPKIIKDIAQKLFDIFYIDDYKYGRQLDDGSYRLVREKITPVTVENMLIKQKSLLTYQEFHSLDVAYIKWICIDLDISKQEIDTNEVNIENLNLVKQSADDICIFLDSIKIPYLLEFSGRRGFHIWIVFEELLTKEDGYNLISYILSHVELQNNIIADKFPTTPIVAENSKGIGKGVKLPLSQNKSSQKLSFFIKNKEFDCNNENWLAVPTNEFLIDQLDILCNTHTVSKNLIQKILIDYKPSGKAICERILKSQKIKPSFLSEDTSLDTILESLKKCSHIASILEEYQKGLGGKERNILSGLLGRLQTKSEPNFGYKLLLELFSNIKGFNKEITERKLENIKYYSPITCAFFDNCQECKRNKITSPVQLIDGVILEDVPPFKIDNIDNKLFLTLKEAQHKYSLSNDEVPLFPQLQKTECMSVKEISKLIEDVFNGKKNIEKESYKFKRIEGKKIRTLYNLEHKINLITTYLISILNNLFYTEISNYSFGYQLAPSFYNDNIFTNWFINWGLFSKNIEHVLFNEEYDDYFLVKIDIKGFYDNVDLQRLDIKLFEEAPSNIKVKLNALDPKELNKYKNIVTYLIALTKEVTGNTAKGLPQGPAYARYLAELYLLGLDKLTEDYIRLNKGREFYNRFVDDAYIFLESEERAIELNQKIEGWLKNNNLELNTTKSELCNVKEYRESGKFKKYKDDVKYTINQANKKKNILTNSEIQNAFIELENLTNDSKFGLKDNLRFFFYQFKDDVRLNYIRKELLKVLPFSNDGRGTLYMMFYTDLLHIYPNEFLNLIGNIDKLKGLSLTHYMNTILLEWDKIDNKEVFLNKLIEKTSHRDDICNADKLLILTIAIKQNIRMSPQFMDNCPTIIKTSVLKTPKIKYRNENYDMVENSLRDITDSELFIKELFRIINTNELDINVARNLANYTLTRFSEWNNEKLEFLNIENNLLLYFHCLCYFTLFESSDTHSNVTISWTILLEKSNHVTVKNKIEFLWIKQLVNFCTDDFSNNSYSLILGNLSGSVFSTYNCPNNFIDKYRDVLLFLLFSKSENLDNFLLNIDSFSDDSLFYSWLKNENVKLYPKNHNICMQNLAVNGLIVLENIANNKMFIKSINGKIDTEKFDFIECENCDNNEFEYPKDGFSILDGKIDKTDLVNFLISLSAKIKKHEAFKNNYNVNYPVFYNPIFFNEGKPLVPFYSLFEKAVSVSGIVKFNTIEFYWENLLEMIKSLNGTEIKIVNDNTQYNYSIEELDEKFFPDSELVIKDSEDKINFIKEFVIKVEGHKINTIFDFQYYWSLTILEIISKKERNKQSVLLKYLHVHFSCFKEDNCLLTDILFTVDDNVKINNTLLSDVFTTINKSILCFQTQLSSPESGISDVIDNYSSIEKESLTDNIEDNVKLSFSDFALKNVKCEEKTNYATNLSEIKLLINDEKCDFKTLLYFDHGSNLFQTLSSEKIHLINNRDYTYVAKKENKIYIYIPDKEIIKAFERVIKRKDIYLELHESPEKPNNNKLLFPIDDFYKSAFNSYSNVDTLQIEKLLKHHYSNTKDIKGRIVTWLCLFNEKSIEGSALECFMKSNDCSIVKLYDAIIECLSLHIGPETDDIKFFRENIEKYNKSEDHIIFPLKHPYRDANGLERLFEKCEFGKREIDVEKEVDKLLGENCTGKTIVIVADISISGSQAKKAMEYYMSEYSSDEKFKEKTIELEEKKEKYFTINSCDELKKLQGNIKSAKNIIFLSPIMTKKFKESILNELKIKGIEVDRITFEYSNSLLNEDSYSLGKVRLNVKNKELLYALMKDRELIKKIFNVKLKSYKNGISDSSIVERNTLLRIGSLPTKHIELFSLKPKNGSCSLLDYVDNWKK